MSEKPRKSLVKVRLRNLYQKKKKKKKSMSDCPKIIMFVGLKLHSQHDTCMNRAASNLSV